MRRDEASGESAGTSKRVPVRRTSNATKSVKATATKSVKATATKPVKATTPAKAKAATPVKAAKTTKPLAGKVEAKVEPIRSRKGAQTRARLIEAGQFIFERDGFLEARIADIAKHAGVSHGSFYHYFESKEQIFREIADAQEAELTAPPHVDEPHSATELERIERANRRYFERYRENGKIMAVVEEVSRYDTYVNDARLRRQHHFAERADVAIRRLQSAGLADSSVDPEIAALALGAMVGRFAELWLVEEWSEFDFDKVVEQITKLWTNAIGLKEPVKRATRKR